MPVFAEVLPVGLFRKLSRERGGYFPISKTPARK
jgi:hypothetical protein